MFLVFWILGLMLWTEKWQWTLILYLSTRWGDWFLILVSYSLSTFFAQRSRSLGWKKSYMQVVAVLCFWALWGVFWWFLTWSDCFFVFVGIRFRDAAWFVWRLVVEVLKNPAWIGNRECAWYWRSKDFFYNLGLYHFIKFWMLGSLLCAEQRQVKQSLDLQGLVCTTRT